MISSRIAVVMAAGKGTRMKSDLPKVLFPLLDRPMVEYVLDALEQAGIERVLLVVGYRSDLMRETLAHRVRAHARGASPMAVEFVEQTEQLGTGHAVMMCRDALGKYDGPVLVVAGDCPMIRVASIRKMFDAYETRNVDDTGTPGCILGTAFKDDPQGLGRIVRDSDGSFLGIVEEKDATAEQKAITEVNMSYYLFSAPDLLAALDHLKTDNAQGEYYITDAPAVLHDLGKTVLALPVLEPIESLGVNTVEELALVEDAMKKDRQP